MGLPALKLSPAPEAVQPAHGPGRVESCTAVADLGISPRVNLQVRGEAFFLVDDDAAVGRLASPPAIPKANVFPGDDDEAFPSKIAIDAKVPVLNDKDSRACGGSGNRQGVKGGRRIHGPLYVDNLRTVSCPPAIRVVPVCRAGVSNRGVVKRLRLGAVRV